jgi:hypothetical protein
MKKIPPGWRKVKDDEKMGLRDLISSNCIKAGLEISLPSLNYMAYQKVVLTYTNSQGNNLNLLIKKFSQKQLIFFSNFVSFQLSVKMSGSSSIQ